ncbi:MAG: YfhO family protein, partial [Bacilli bacterium]|nr:YfhO family protein [Bacilli bacterium]
FSPLIAAILFCFMLFTPFCYYAFHGFTYAYSRWTLFVTTSLIAYISFYIDRIQEEPRWHIIVGYAFSILVGLAAILLAVHISKTYSNFKLRYVYSSMGEYGFLILEGVIYAVYSTVLCTLIYLTLNKKQLKSVLTFAVTIEAIVMGALTLNGHGYENYMNVNGGYENNKVFQTVIDQIKKDDPTYYRCYSSQENSSARNDSMRHNYNGLGMFHSVYNFNTAAFLNWSQINDYSAPSSYSASYVEKRQDLDTFLGVKYYFIHKDKAFWGNDAAKELKSEHYRPNVPVGFVDISNKYPNSLYYVYENTNFIDFAYSFDKVATYSNVNDEGEVKEPSVLFNYTFENEDMYLKTAIVGENNLNYVNGLINEENIKDHEEYRELIDAKIVSSLKYKITYYDIHQDAESGRVDASSAGFASKLLDLSEYESSSAKPSKWTYNGRYVSVIEPLESFPYDPEGNVYYLRNSYLNTSDINVYLTTLDEEGNERFLTFDNHNDSNFGINWTTRKNWRGFYSAPTYDLEGNKIPAPKVNKIIVVSRKTTMENYQLAYKSGTAINNNIEELKKYPISEVNYKTNHFDFKTNYDSRRVIVTQIPYEKGWTVKANYSDGTSKILDVFTAQGGFVSFISEVGDVSYSLDFYTPYLKIGSYISSIGLFLFATTLVGYAYISLYWINQNSIKEKDFARKSYKNKIF